jgi:ribosome-associated protein
MTAKKTTRAGASAPTRRLSGKKAIALKKAVAASKTAKKTVKKVSKKTAAPKKAARAKAPVKTALAALVAETLDDLKGKDIVVLDVRGASDVTDTIVIASGTSDRHVKSLAVRVQQRAREAGFRSLGMEGEREGEWVLVDLDDVIVHVMLPRIREFYALEKLWDSSAAESA